MKLLKGDCRQMLKGIDTDSVQSCVTSPPYWGLRHYGDASQFGSEVTPGEFVENLVSAFREVWRVLREDGTLWLNLGDSYSKTFIKPKDLIGIPWRVAFALQADGWYLRQDIIWHKPNPMPESVTDRCTKAHEYIFLLSKAPRYFYNAKAIEEPAKWERWGNQTENKKHPGTAGHLGGKRLDELPVRDTKNKRSVWTVPTCGFAGAHFATFPPALISPCILAGSKRGDIILDPFAGSGTTGKVALENGRSVILCETNPDYYKMIEQRTAVTVGFGI